MNIIPQIKARIPSPEQWTKEFESDFERDAETLSTLSLRCEEDGNKRFGLLMIRSSGTMCAPLNMCLEQGTWPNQILTDQSLAGDIFVVELDAEKHPERYSESPAAYGTLRSITPGKCRYFVKLYLFQCRQRIVRYATKYGSAQTLVETATFDRAAFESFYGKIISVTPSYSADDMQRIEFAARQLRAASKEVKS